MAEHRVPLHFLTPKDVSRLSPATLKIQARAFALLMTKLEPGSIYLTLCASDMAPAVYSWALFAPYSVGTTGRIFRLGVTGKPAHRTSRTFFPSVLDFEAKEYDVLGDPRLFLLLRLGTLGEWSLDDLHNILAKVSIPHPDDEYSQFFDGRTWVIKAIMRMSAYGIIQSRRLGTMEQEIQDLATQALRTHCQGGGWTLGKI